MLYFKFHGTGVVADIKSEPDDEFIPGDFESTVALRYRYDKETGKVVDDFVGFSDDELNDEIIRRIEARNKLTESIQP